MSSPDPGYEEYIIGGSGPFYDECPTHYQHDREGGRGWSWDKEAQAYTEPCPHCTQTEYEDAKVETILKAITPHGYSWQGAYVDFTL